MDIGDIAQRFLNHEPIDGASFRLNDFVSIITGEHSGCDGFVVSITKLSPEVTYLVEIEWNGDVEVTQSQLRPAYA